jgi:hypothetical protein
MFTTETRKHKREQDFPRFLGLNPRILAVHATVQEQGLYRSWLLSLHFFLFCQPEDDKKQQELTLKKWFLLAFLAFLAVKVQKSVKVSGVIDWKVYTGVLYNARVDYLLPVCWGY